MLNFLRFTPSFEFFSHLVEWRGIFDGIPGLTDIISLGLDFMLTSFGDLDLEQVLLLLPVLWNISDFDVLFDGMLELYHLLLECLTRSRVLERFESSSDGFSLFVGEGSIIGFSVSLFPTGTLERLVLISDIIKFISDLIKSRVWNVDSGTVLVDVLLKNFTDILPLLDELLALWGSQECLIEFFDMENLL